MEVTRQRRKAVVGIVFVALLLDNILVTCIVPIIPNYLRERSGHSTHDHDHHHKLQHTNSGLSHNDQGSNPPHTGILGFSIPRAVVDDYSNFTDSQENTRMGILIGTKTFVQLFANIGVGYFTNRIGYTIPMFTGFIILMLSTTLFALATDYHILVAARAIQGIGTAFSTTSGMGLLALLFPDQRERGFAQTIAFSGLAAGVLIGPPYGGVVYDWTGGKEAPFLILVGVTMVTGVFQVLVIRPRYQPEGKKGNGFLKLLSDPYIVVTIASITLSTLTVAVLEPVLPIWMYHTMGAPAWMQGVAFVPNTLAYLLSMQIFGTIAHRCQCYDVSHRWVSAFVGALLMGSSMTTVPFCTDIYRLIAPLFINGVGLALISSSMLPHVGYLVDLRHVSVYGSAYALTDNAYCLAFSLGPAVSGPMVDSIGFSWTLIAMGFLSVATAPLVCFLKNARARQSDGEEEVIEQTPLLTKTVAFAEPDGPHDIFH